MWAFLTSHAVTDKSNDDMEQAINGGQLTVLASRLHHELSSAPSACERAAIRKRTVASFLEHRQNLRSVSAVVHLIFEQRAVEYDTQVSAAEGTEKAEFEFFRDIAQSELSDDKANRAAQWTTIRNWGADFLLLILDLQLMDQETNTFWNLARAASNRIRDWSVARSMLNLRLFTIHNQKQSWLSVCNHGHQIRPEYFKIIQEGAASLTQQDVEKYNIAFDRHGLVDFTNWTQLKALLEQTETCPQTPNPNRDHEQTNSVPDVGPTARIDQEAESTQQPDPARAIHIEDVGGEDGNVQRVAPHNEDVEGEDGNVQRVASVMSTARVLRSVNRPPKRPLVVETPTVGSRKKPRTRTISKLRPHGVAGEYLAACSKEERCAHVQREAEARKMLDTALEDILSCLAPLSVSNRTRVEQRAALTTKDRTRTAMPAMAIAEKHKGMTSQKLVAVHRITTATNSSAMPYRCSRLGPAPR